MKKEGKCNALFCLLFSRHSSLARTACYEQSEKSEIASWLRLKIEQNNADELSCWRNNAERLPLLK